MKAGKCVKCGGVDIMVGRPGEYGHGGMEMPMALTAEPRWVMSGRNPRYPLGLFACYVCRGCGYTEWYVDDPGSVPIGDQYQTALLSQQRPVIEAAPDVPDEQLP